MTERPTYLNGGAGGGGGEKSLVRNRAPPTKRAQPQSEGQANGGDPAADPSSAHPVPDEVVDGAQILHQLQQAERPEESEGAEEQGEEKQPPFEANDDDDDLDAPG